MVIIVVNEFGVISIFYGVFCDYEENRARINIGSN